MEFYAPTHELKDIAVGIAMSMPGPFISTDIANHPDMILGSKDPHKYATRLVRELRENGSIVQIGEQLGHGKKRIAKTYVVRNSLSTTESLERDVNKMSTERLLEVYRIVSDALVKRVQTA